MVCTSNFEKKERRKTFQMNSVFSMEQHFFKFSIVIEGATKKVFKVYIPIS
jgi:hypothetical protein